MKVIITFCFVATLAFMVVSGQDTGKLIGAVEPICEAPANCPLNEVLNCGGNVCQPICADNRALRCPNCNKSLGKRMVCQCKSGYIRAYDYGPCVLTTKCP